MKIKQFLGQVHLWLGLLMGLLFFVIAFSGALYTWEPELSRLFYHQAVEPQAAPFVPISTVKATLAREFPEGDFRTVLYRDRASTIEVLLYVPGTYYKAFLNPYDGSLIHLQDMKKGSLNYLKLLHRNLLLGDVGRQIVHWVTLLALLMLVTGLVLWWPPSKAGRKQRFTLKRGASPKRLNYDLHNVLGFYATWIVVFAVGTGIFWGFGVIKTGLRTLTGEDKIVYEVPKSEANEADTLADPFVLMDSLLLDFRDQYPDQFVRVSNPHAKTDPIEVAVIRPNPAVYHADHYYFDRYSGAQLQGHFAQGLHAKSSRFQILNKLMYPIHFGSVLGFFGRLLMFLASLIAASLPITGFLVWWGKRKKK